VNDIVINKISSIQRCIKRAREEFKGAGDFKNDLTAQDASVLNVLRACEQSIDLANHFLKTKKLGIPASSAGSFELLCDAGIIGADLSLRLRRMVSFRNTVIHRYQDLQIEILISVITAGLDDLLLFCDTIMQTV